MCKLSSLKNSFYFCIALYFGAGLSVHASTIVTMNQADSTVVWQISGNNYDIGEVYLTIVGPDLSAATISGCIPSPLLCFYTFNGSSLSFQTDGLEEGTYNWQVEIKPLIDDLACSSPADVRDAQGGYQGLSGGPAPFHEDNYINCLINSGLLPTDEQELFESGSFNIESNGGLIVPIDQETGTPDNIPPFALCQDVALEGSGETNCSILASIDNGSYDPDGFIESIVQLPEGPYGLGATDVTLGVTDNQGAISVCNAVITVTDNLVPDIQCPVMNTMTPPAAPATFTASSSDTCSTPVTQVTSYDCYRINPRGRRIDTNDSCVVSLSNDSITVIETSGVNSFIDWTVESTDSSDNSTESVCTINVIHPNG